MRTLVAALLFLSVAGIAFLVANRFVKRWLPASQPASQAMMFVVSVLLVFASVFFFTAWGLNPAVIQINLQQSLNPLRWVNWVLSALNFGVAQAVILALFRSRIDVVRRLATLPPPVRGTESALTEGPVQAPVLGVGGAAGSFPAEEPARAHGSADEARGDEKKQAGTFGAAHQPFGPFVRSRKGAVYGADKSPEFTRGERVAVAVLAVWVVVHLIVLGWVRTL